MGNGECSGRVAAVTGAGSGVGLAIARRLQQQGYRVYNLSRHPGQGKGLSFLSCDVTREEQVQAAVSAIWQQQGGLDVLVCNAGMGVSGAVEFIPEEDRRVIIDYWKCVCFGLVSGWLEAGMQGDVRSRFHRIFQLKNSELEAMLERCLSE